MRRLEASETELANISNLLQHVVPIIKPESPEQVEVGCEVTVKGNSKTVSYTIVCPLEIDIAANKISEESPLGRALLGKRLHDKVTLPARKSVEYVYEIVDIQ